MPTADRGPRFAVRFDELALAEDLQHATAAGRRAGDRARRELERDGVSADRLLRCQPEARDGTRLGGCVKTRVPWPDGRWGLVLVPIARRDRTAHAARARLRRTPPDRTLAPERLPGRAPAPARRLTRPRSRL